jgi:GntR family transcriptional regulator/MocR family aminotransferase
MSGLAIKIKVPHRIDDVALARSVLPQGIAPMPLSLWWSAPERREPGFLLGVTNLRPKVLDKACTTLERAIGSL